MYLDNAYYSLHFVQYAIWICGRIPLVPNIISYHLDTNRSGCNVENISKMSMVLTRSVSSTYQGHIRLESVSFVRVSNAGKGHDVFCAELQTGMHRAHMFHGGISVTMGQQCPHIADIPQPKGLVWYKKLSALQTDSYMHVHIPVSTHHVASPI